MALDDAERRVRAAVVAMARGRVWEPNLTAFLTLYDHRGTEIERLRAAVAERDAEIARLRAAAAALLHDLDVNLELSEHFNPPAAELFEHRIYDLRRALAAAPAPADEEGAR